MQKIYRATNTKTGEVIEGPALELMKRLDVCKGTIYAYNSHGGLLYGIWSIKEVVPDEEGSNSLPKSLLQEWDEVTKNVRRGLMRSRR